MIGRIARHLPCAALAAALLIALMPPAAAPAAAQSGAGAGAMARLEPADFSRLPGWTSDDHGAALGAFQRSCAALTRARPRWKEGWERLCAAAAGVAPDARSARAFFESAFTPYRIDPGTSAQGFLTGYYEPEATGARRPDARFHVPIYKRPPDLVTIRKGMARQGLPTGFEAGRRTAQGGLAPYPSRSEIERGALKGRGLELVWLDDPVEAFFIHVQGSSRVRLADGSVIRLGFDGKNGHPYTSIGKVLVERTGIPASEMTADRLRAWLNDNPGQAPGQAHELMWQNDSFIFFRELDIPDPALGPVGAQGVHLTAGRSLAVDRAFHALGLPFYIAADLPAGDGTLAPFHRLMIAQDTGSAIVGPARGDIFWGSGAKAGHLAGLVRHPGDFYLLAPAGYPLPAWTGRHGR